MRHRRRKLKKKNKKRNSKTKDDYYCCCCLLVSLFACLGEFVIAIRRISLCFSFSLARQSSLDNNKKEVIILYVHVHVHISKDNHRIKKNTTEKSNIQIKCVSKRYKMKLKDVK